MKLKHPDNPHPITVTPEQAPLYRAQGWAEVKAAKKATTKKTTGSKDPA